MLRVEDIDRARVVDGSVDRILEDLAWLGLHYDEGPIFQSSHGLRYEAATAALDTYPCDCSRADIARVASAPHAGEGGTLYPGICRDLDPHRTMKRPAAIRLRVPVGARVSFVDAIRGAVEGEVDDFVLRRGDGTFAYQLAVAVDDADEAISMVVRGDDLLDSTPRQILLLQMLGLAVPAYAHVPLVLGPDGERLAKRTNAASIRQLRERGMSAARVRSLVEEALGSERPIAEWRKTPWPIPTELTLIP